MKSIQKKFKDKTIYFDGAFGTYYASLYDDKNCEWANINNPGRVLDIHREYASSGADLLRTNTYYANVFNPTMDLSSSEIIIKQGINIAHKAANEFDDCYPCADIGPILYDGIDGHGSDKKDILNEYIRIIDIFLDNGAEIFVFETMASTTPLDEVVKYLRDNKNDAFIICQFAVRPDGYTRSSIGIERLIREANKLPCDVIGVNCASGPTHILHHAERILSLTDKPVSALPNAGFPILYEGRELYSAPKDYFAQKMIEIIDLGVKFPGGCCGTTPEYIKSLVNYHKDHKKTVKHVKQSDSISENIINNKMPDIDIHVELTPPKNGNLKSILLKAKKLKNLGIKSITLPDSPLGVTRMSPLILSSVIRENFSLQTITHLCCRDRNITAIKSDIMGAWALGLRDILCVTGDSVAAGARDDIKSVFNLSAIRLIELISQMNEELFSSSPIRLYAAVNFGAKYFKAELSRSLKKYNAGARIFLSQPVFTQSEIDNIGSFKQACDGKVMVGILPPVNYKNALFMKHEVPGINIPDSIIDALYEIDDRNEAEDIGAKLCSNIAISALEYADGLYIILPFGRHSALLRLLNYITEGTISLKNSQADMKI